MLDYVAYAGIGKLLIYLGQKFPASKLPIIGKFFQGGEFLGDLISCDLCLGVWLYFFLALALDVNVVYEITDVPILGHFITGAFTSFVMHLFSIGWKSKFEKIIVT